MASSRSFIVLPFRPLPSATFRFLCPRRHASATANARRPVRNPYKELRNMPRKTSDPGTRQLRHAQKKQREALRPLTQPVGLPPIIASEPLKQEIERTEGYFVRRTPTRNLPIYQLRKKGGNLLQTRVRKIEGSVEDLKVQLENVLEPKPEWIRVNPVNRHVEMKGWYRNQIQRFLFQKGF